MECPCGSSFQFEHCCARIHNGILSPSSAEMLMRARYSAFAIGNIDFLYNSFHPSTRRFQNKQDIKKWALENIWLGLEIVKSTTLTVEFKARYQDLISGAQYVHHEKSNFKELQGTWYYVDGRLI
ncbi:SEC-C motif-containing protein [Sphingobacterium nematocida]|uniref:SEC-C motif-containing protein n=1 Tax=Sphingobacterium nematocida TaxID=1513896 RepID=A0A1T5G173_9SPHI|nr:YchJ family metal-binding protein [Sphingobacterium nematocida]SKC02099.1 SEC-C motif-containing protein [Sphingobacterium nematocida]